jgi:type II secretion system protein G
MYSGPRSNASFMRMMFCVFLVNAMAILGSARAQSADAEIAILRAREAGSSMKVRELEEKIHELEGNERRNQPLYGFDDFVLSPMLANRGEMERIQSAKAVNSFLSELAAAQKRGAKGMYLMLKIIQLSEEYPNALVDPEIKELVYRATDAGLKFLRAHNEDKRKQRAQNDLRTIAGQLRLYQSDSGFLPTSEQGIEALVTKPTGSPKPSKWRKLLERNPLDPWGEPYIYRPQDDGFALASSGPDREQGSDDDLVFTSSAQE